MEAVAQQGDDRLHPGQLAQVVSLWLAVAGYHAGCHGRVQGRYFQFVTCRAVGACLEVKFVRVDGLGSAVERVDFRRHAGDGGVDRMDERSLAHALVRVGQLRAKQQAGGANGAGGDHELPGFQGDRNAGWGDAIRAHGGGEQVVDPVLTHHQAFCPQTVEELCFVIQCARDGGE